MLIASITAVAPISRTVAEGPQTALEKAEAGLLGTGDPGRRTTYPAGANTRGADAGVRGEERRHGHRAELKKFQTSCCVRYAQVPVIAPSAVWRWAVGCGEFAVY